MELVVEEAGVVEAEEEVVAGRQVEQEVGEEVDHREEEVVLADEVSHRVVVVVLRAEEVEDGVVGAEALLREEDEVGFNENRVGGTIFHLPSPLSVIRILTLFIMHSYILLCGLSLASGLLATRASYS